MFGDPRYKIDEFVQEIAGRRDAAMSDLHDTLRQHILGLVDQLAMLKKHDPNIDLRRVAIGRARWINDYGNSVLVYDIEHNGRSIRPSQTRYW